MNFWFCETCGKRLTDKDLEEGAARNKKLKGVFCAECAVGVTTMEMEAIGVEQLSKGTGVPPAPAPSSSVKSGQILQSQRITTKRAYGAKSPAPRSSRLPLMIASGAMFVVACLIAVGVKIHSAPSEKPPIVMVTAQPPNAMPPAPKQSASDPTKQAVKNSAGVEPNIGKNDEIAQVPPAPRISPARDDLETIPATHSPPVENAAPPVAPLGSIAPGVPVTVSKSDDAPAHVRPAANIVVSAGLAGYWKLDEGSGSHAGDASGNDNAGVLREASGWMKEKDETEKRLSLDGKNCVQINDTGTSPLDMSKAISICAWIKPAHLVAGQEIILEKPHTAYVDPYYMYFLGHERGGRICFWLTLNGKAMYFSTDPVLTAAHYAHIAATFDGNAMRIYVDGKISSELKASGSIGKNSSPLIIGGHAYRTGENFEGTIRDVRLYDRALTAPEISEIMKTTAPGAGRKDELETKKDR